MESLEKVIGEGIILVDTNCLHPTRNTFLHYDKGETFLYPTGKTFLHPDNNTVGSILDLFNDTTLSDICPEEVKAYLNGLRLLNRLINDNPRVYFPRGVKVEYSSFINGLKYCRDKLPIKRRNYMKTAEEKLNLLSEYLKIAREISKKISKRKILRFSEEQEEMYRRIFDFLVNEERVEKFRSEHFQDLNSKINHNNRTTDEELVAHGIVLAHYSLVKILSDDSDVGLLVAIVRNIPEILSLNRELLAENLQVYRKKDGLLEISSIASRTF